MSKTYRNTRRGKINYEIGTRQYWDIYYDSFDTIEVKDEYESATLVPIPEVLKRISKRKFYAIVDWLEWYLPSSRDCIRLGTDWKYNTGYAAIFNPETNRYINTIRQWINTQTLPLPLEELRTFMTIHETGCEQYKYILVVPNKLLDVVYNIKVQKRISYSTIRTKTTKVIPISRNIIAATENNYRTVKLKTKKVIKQNILNLRDYSISEIIEDEHILNNFETWIQSSI